MLNGAPASHRKVRPWQDRLPSQPPKEPRGAASTSDVWIWNAIVLGLSVALVMVIVLLAVRWLGAAVPGPARPPDEAAAVTPGDGAAHESQPREIVSRNQDEERRSQRGEDNAPVLRKQLQELSKQLGELHDRLDQSKAEQNALNQRLDEALAAKSPPVRDSVRRNDDRRVTNRPVAADRDDQPEDDDDAVSLLPTKGAARPAKGQKPAAPPSSGQPIIPQAPAPPDPGPAFVLGEFRQRPMLLRRAEFQNANEELDALMTKVVQQRVAGQPVDVAILDELTAMEKRLDERIDARSRAHELTPSEYINAKRYVQSLHAARRYLES
jgi:Skp family chaperone for outer membrane proteins